MGAIRLVVAEDNVLVRAGITAVLAEAGDLELCATCQSYDELVDRVAEHEPDVVLTDVRMPPSFTDEGIRAANLFRQTRPELAVVVLSQYLDAELALALVEGGSQRRGYLLKERVAHAGQLADAVRTIAAGGSFIDPLVVEHLVAARQRAASSPLRRLTDREREVLAEIAAGCSNAVVGQRLFISERAVEKHVSSIFTKLGLLDGGDRNRRVAAVLLFLAETGPAA